VSVNGPSLRQTIRCSVTGTALSLQFADRQGTYRPWWRSIAVTVHGPKPTIMTIADQPRAATVAIR
jgi:alpha-glucosidase